jgi:FkbM family methyltransferase
LTLALETEVRTFRTPKGGTAQMALRSGTVDHDICYSSMVDDEYRLRDLDLSGLAIDIGAYCGAVTIAMLLANPDLFVKAVEVVPENVEAMRRNLEINGLEDRCEIVFKAAGGPDEASRTCYMRHRAHPAATTAYVNAHRFVGNSFWNPANGPTFEADAVQMDCVSLSDLIEGWDSVAFIKTDAEGAEWEFLADPAVSRVQRIHGEYHWDYLWQGDAATRKRKAPKRAQKAATAQAEIARLLGETHVLTMDEHPTIGHFEAVQR